MFDFAVLEQATQALGVLRNAPILEAVIACNFQAETQDSQEVLQKAAMVAFPDFTWTEQQKVSVNVQLSDVKGKPSALTDTSLGGRRYIGKQEDYPLTLILDNSQMAVSMMRPYSSWEVFSPQAIAFGQQLAERAKIELISYGLRYLNQINFELPLSEYLREEVCVTYPVAEVPLFRQKQRSEFVVPNSWYAGSMAWLFEPINMAPQVTGNLLVDIDVGVSDQRIGRDYIHEQLEHMRLLKNYFFYNTVSKKVLDLCR
jgi:uncharacterized protein (TIGR04255 family)